MPVLPAIEECGTSSEALTKALSTLLEPSPPLIDVLVPSLSGARFASYPELLRASESKVLEWPDEVQAAFIAGHPRIGEVSGLSALSAHEQASKVTPPEVLERLKALNAQYEQTYPGLVYITFVNGRTRAAIADELDAFLSSGPGLASPGSPAYKTELERACRDVFRIASARLEALQGAEAS